MKIDKIDKELSVILNEMINKEQDFKEELALIHDDYKLSALNLYRYLILRSYDLRKYHDSLSDLGISSMRTTEGYVLKNLYNVVKNLRIIQGKPYNDDFIEGHSMIGYKKSKKLLVKHANLLFNEGSKKHFTEIMVTMPEEAAEHPELIRDMVLNGMEVARINLSHGDIDQWSKMVSNINTVNKQTGQQVKIYMDLSGPKLRTSNIEIQSISGKIKKSIPIQVGEHIILTKRDTLGKKSTYGHSNEQIEKAEIGVQLQEVITDAMIGDEILFDDGMIKSKVIGKSSEDLEVVITAAYKSKLSSYKGINLPSTKLNLPAITDKDMENLPFVVAHADIVGYSFVRTGDDVQRLYKELDRLDARNLGVVFKIENQEAFKNLPDILFNGMQRKKIGVMIARGDLAVELGFERIAEVQSQILWLCEAAHIPVIWATQVLDNLAKTGMPTRAEISDAALGTSAECVMLNKGPYIVDAIRVLKDILIRMEGHSFKKKNELRALNISKDYLEKRN